MENAIFEQFGYKSAYDLMTDLARDIANEGELVDHVRITPHILAYGFKYDGGYWMIVKRCVNRCVRVYSIEYHDTLDSLKTVLGVFTW